MCRGCFKIVSRLTRPVNKTEERQKWARVYCDTTGRLMPDIDTFSFSYMPADVMSAVMEVQ